MSDTDDTDMEVMAAKPTAAATVPLKDKTNKRLSVERIYQKKSQLEHILLRPDTYIGSVEKETKQMWIYDEEQNGMQLRDISYVPGLYKIFDEVLVNAADNKQRDKSMNCIRVDIDSERNQITIYNNGKGIPIVEHKDEKMFVPTLIFGHLLTSSNYDDKEKKVVGGRNGYGAKLCNIFSQRFKVETSCKEYRKQFVQIWTDNMKTATEPKITASTGEDYTRVTFTPDLQKFGMQSLDKDIVGLFSRRAYDVAGSSKGVKVYLNGKRLPVMGFKDYVDQFVKDKEDESGQPLRTAYEQVSDRWEIACTVSDKGFQQNSFVNSIATTRGGKHVDYIADQIVAKMTDIIKKKNKAGVNVKPFQLKNHLWIFVNCLIENPTFDSQTKETMTLQAKSFGSKCQPSDKFFAAANKTGIVESVMQWVQFKAQTELSKQCNSKKQSKLKGIPKLEDANDAGTRHSIDCTLILTEGDSAKSLVIAGLGVIGRDKYGVFPLRGKMLNVREATHKQILENAEINNLIKILGLQYKKQYTTQEDLKTLRYGKLMIMTDQDQDGSHIKGLLINFIHHNWPKLLELNFLEEFITPIVKVSKGSNSSTARSFYSLPEFEEWKSNTANWNTWKIKYYKGLGTSTANEAKEYFSDMIRHRIRFKYSGADDDLAVKLAFSKKLVEQRKDWLTNSMEDRKRRRELGLPDVYLYESNTRSVSYKDFVNKELILFSNMDNERSIPSLMDGLKPGQRKVLFTCFKRNDKREVKVAQLAGSVGEHSAYHHGEASLMSTIIGLAQNYVGSNNINLLQPLGQFGTRLQGGKDAASPRYIFTMLSSLSRKIFPAMDDPLLNTLMDDNLRIEPEYYAPILPMVLVNGAEGIGTGWSTKIPNYNPREIVQNLRRMIRGERPEPMQPWFKGFRGSILQIDPQKYVINGEIGLLSDKSFEITELPVRTWTQAYKESTLEVLLHGTDKQPSFIQEYKEYHTESTIRFVVTLSEQNLQKSLASGIHKIFKIQSSMSTTSMVLFDHNGCLKRYETPEMIIEDYFPVRLDYYRKRKAYYEGKLEAEARKLENMARFILEKNDGQIKLENIKKKDFVRQLIDRKYDSDPVKDWEQKHKDSIGDNTTEEAEEAEEEVVIDGEEDEATTAAGGSDGQKNYNYLFDMRMSSMLRENVDRLLKERDAKKQELEELKRMTPEGLWERDLDEFVAELDRVEDGERLASVKALQSKSSKTTGGKSGSVKNWLKPGAGGGKSSATRLSIEAKPSDFAERVEPKVDIDSYKKTEKVAKKRTTKSAAANNDEKGSGDVEVVGDSDDDDLMDKALSERIGGGIKPSAKVAKKKSAKTDETIKEKKEKKTATAKTATTKPTKKTAAGGGEDKKKTKKKSPWSDSDSDDDGDDEPDYLSDDETDEDDYITTTTKTTTTSARIVSTKPKTIDEVEEPISDDLVSFNETTTTTTTTNDYLTIKTSDTEELLSGKTDTNNLNKKNKKTTSAFSDDSDKDSDDTDFQPDDEEDFEPKKKKMATTKPSTKAVAKKQKTNDKPPKPTSSKTTKAVTAKPKQTGKVVTKPKKILMRMSSDSSDETDDEKPMKKKSKKSAELVDDDSIVELMDDDLPTPPPREKSGRGAARQRVKYNFDDSDDDSD